jgi:hypothetical protein
LLAVLATSSELTAQWDSAVVHLRAGDAVAAESLLASEVGANFRSPDLWLNLGSARWLIGDDVGAAASWLRGAKIAPRDRRLRQAIIAVQTLPTELRGRLPTVPISSPELIVLALVAWLLGWRLLDRRRSLAQLAFAVTVLSVGTAASRMFADGDAEALVRHTYQLRVSPLAVAPIVGDVPAWSTVMVEQQLGEWALVALDDNRRGWLPKNQLAMLSGID